MSDHAVEISSSVSVTSEEVTRQIRAIIDNLTQQLAHFCHLMREMKNAQANRRLEETASHMDTRSLSGSTNWSDLVTEPTNPSFPPLYTLVPPDRLTSSGLPEHSKGFNLDDEDDGTEATLITDALGSECDQQTTRHTTTRCNTEESATHQCTKFQMVKRQVH